MANYQLLFLDEKEENDIQSFATDWVGLSELKNNEKKGSTLNF